MGDLSLEDYNEENATTVLSARSRDDGSFSGDTVLHLEADTLAGPLNGVQALGQGAGSVGVKGQSHTGVLGLGEVIGVIGRVTHGGSQLPITFVNAGVLGTSFVGGAGRKHAAGVIGESNEGYGVYGTSKTGAGVMGDSDEGEAGVIGVGSTKYGVYGAAEQAGVYGTGPFIGVHGQSFDGIGVLGETGFPEAKDPGLLAGYFIGPVMVQGAFVVFGAKSAAVRHRDGTHRLLYSIESPESWFEDFGEAKLTKGKADVALDGNFAAVVKNDKYLIFLSPYGDSNGLYISRRTRKGFQVREHQGGKSSILFSYRVVARRKDVKAKRFEKVSMPSIPRAKKKETFPRPKRSTHAQPSFESIKKRGSETRR